SLGDLGDYPGLEQGPPQRVAFELTRRLDVQEGRRQTGVVEVELGRLDEPFAKIGEERRQAEDDVARLQHSQPRSGRGLGDAAVIGQGRQVEDLPGAASAETEEGL